MSYASIIGILLLTISYIIFRTTHTVFELMIKEYSFSIGIIGGIGLGLILGGFLGWIFKYKKLSKQSKKDFDNQDKI
jgi:NhaP-type Na+/H+ or K+/H+ antiporter